MKDESKGKPEQPSAAKPQSSKHWIFAAVNLLLLAALIYGINVGTAGPPPKRIAYSDFLNQITQDKLSEVQITDQELIGVEKQPVTHQGSAKAGAPARIIATRLPGIDETDLLKQLQQHHVKFIGRIDTNGKIWGAILGWLFPLIP